MNFELTDEQRMLRESTARYLADRYNFESREKHQQNPAGYDLSVWRDYAELGLLALPLGEEYGGFGGGPIETMIVMEEMGRALTLEPYLSTCVLAPALLAAATPEQKNELLTEIASGTATVAFAHREPHMWKGATDLATQALRNGETYTLSGKKTLVLHGDSANRFIVSARLPSGATGLFLAVADEGLAVQGYRTQDGMRAAELTFDGFPARHLSAVEDASSTIAQAEAEALAAICSEAVGAMDEALKLTTEYLKTRQQFGVAIGAFQGLQHQAAEMVVEVEQARSMAMYAAIKCRRADVGERDAALSAAKVQICRSARFVGQTAVQLHGGVGMTMELAIGHYFKRLAMIERTFGDQDFHLDRLSALGGLAA